MNHIQPLMPFWGLAPEQIDTAWLDRGYGVEALLFKAEELRELDRFEKILADLPEPSALTCHFPMDADYIDDAWARDRLYEFIDVAHRQGARGVVVHTNHFIDVEQLEHVDLRALRHRYLEFFAEVDAHLAGSGLWVGVENMPLMGDAGKNVDAAFVYPHDFADFAYESVGVTFDLAHWMGSLETASAASKLGVPPRLLPPTRECGLLDFTAVRGHIKHLHFGAVQGVALPPGRSVAAGGAVPPDGQPGSSYRELVQEFASPGLAMSLEIQELDYRRRVALWQALRWLTDNGFIAPGGQADE